MSSRRRGLTLLEVLVAATVLLLAVLTMLGVIAFGLAGTRNAAGHHTAVLHARQLVELIRSRRLAEMVINPPAPGFSDAPADRIPLEDPPFENDFPPQTGYTRRLVTEAQSTDPNDYKSKLFRVEATVFWRVKRRENKFQVEGLYRAL